MTIEERHELVEKVREAVLGDYRNSRLFKPVTDIGKMELNTIRGMARYVVEAAEDFFPNGYKVRAVLDMDMDATRPVQIRVVRPEGVDLDEALAYLERFDDEWWFKQEVDYHRVIGVYLGD